MRVELHAQTDVGRVRQGNEDNFLVLDLTTERSWTGSEGASPPDGLSRFECGPRGAVLAVSDGMGGALAGDVASRMAVETGREMLVEDARCAGMGATLTAAAVTGGHVYLVQIGDSRAYVIRGGEIRLATKDQSLVQQLVDVGQITEEDAETHMFRNVILQALGAQSDLTPVISRVRLQRGDILLLCSDGL